MYEPKKIRSKAAARAERRRLRRVRENFSPSALKRICEMRETDFAEEFGFEQVDLDLPSRFYGDEDFYLFKDNGADILAVAHLDTVVNHEDRTATFAYTQAGPVVHSGALDDRLGAYILLELMPLLGINHDILLTVGEESGQSTAQFFTAEKDYNWMIEFDRGGSDVVMYQYDDDETRDLVRACGARPADGIFSDISYLEHLEIKGFNWGVGYQDYHSVRGHAYLEDTFEMVSHYLRFHKSNAEVYLPHDKVSVDSWWGGYSRSSTRGHHVGGMSLWTDREEALWMREQEDREQEIIDALSEYDRGDGIDAIADPTQEQIEAVLAEEQRGEDPDYRRSMN